MSTAESWAAALLSAILIASPAYGQEMSGGWSNRVIELERALRDRNCLDVIDEGQHLDIRYFSDADVDACAQGKIEEILQRNQKFVDHLECKMLLEMKAAAEFRRDGAEGLEDAFADVANPIPDSAWDLTRKIGRALDISTVTAAWVDSHQRDKMAADFDLVAERIRLQALSYDEIVKKQRERWEAHMASDPDCPPPDDTDPPPSPDPIQKAPVIPVDLPPPATPEPEPELDLDGRQVYRCHMDLHDPILGHLVFCTEYDSERIGQQPTAAMINMSASICRDAKGTWSKQRCRTGWEKRCLTRKGVAHFYYSFTAGAPESQCKRWRGTLKSQGK